MKLNQIQQEHRALLKELTELGAGYSLVERALVPPNIRNTLENDEKEYGQERLRKLCIAIAARYLILVSVNPHYFDYTTENHVHRALWNNGIKDKDLDYWMTFPREAYFAPNPKHPIPKDLQEEIASLNYPHTETKRREIQDHYYDKE
jgi:hypothetical protein